jgi:DNA-binding NtrC family response regulator
VPGGALDPSVFSLPLTEAKQAFEKAYLEHLLKASGGNISEAARISGRYRADIYRLMHRYGLDQTEYR